MSKKNIITPAADESAGVLAELKRITSGEASPVTSPLTAGSGESVFAELNRITSGEPEQIAGK